MNQQFLHDDMNKAELFAFIRHLLVTSKLIIITNGSEVVCIPPQDTSHLAPSNHEEADTRIILHMADAINKGFKKIFYIVMSAPATGTLQQWVKVTLAISFTCVYHEHGTCLKHASSWQTHAGLFQSHAVTGCNLPLLWQQN